MSVKCITVNRSFPTLHDYRSRLIKNQLEVEILRPLADEDAQEDHCTRDAHVEREWLAQNDPSPGPATKSSLGIREDWQERHST